MIELTFKGNTLSEIHEAIIHEAAGLKHGAEASPKASKNTEKEQAASTGTASKVKTTSTGTYDEIEYSGESTARNLWILLTDGRVIAIKAGGNLPIDEIREKNITRKEYLEIAEEEPERVADSIAEATEKEAKKKDKKDKPVEDETVEDDETEEDDENEEDEDGDDMDKAKMLVAKAKELPGGKAFIKELLEDFDVKRVTKIDDEEDLADFIEDVEEFIEENED